MSISIKKRATAIMLCLLIGISIFTGIVMLSEEVNADEVTTIEAEENTTEEYQPPEQIDYGMENGSWPLSSMLLIVVAAALGVAMMIRKDSENKYRKKFSTIIAIAIPLLGIVMFFAFYDVATTMVIFKPSSLIFAAGAVVQFVNLFVGKGSYDNVDEY